MLDRLRRLFDPYIVLMIVTVGIAAVEPARGRAAPVAGAAADAGIIFLFFLYGARLSTSAALRGLRHWRLHLTVLLSTFVVFPALGVALRAIAPTALPPTLVTGVVFLCILPSTVQSSIAFTSIARGNVPAALCAASASNLIGVFLTPALASWLLHTQGAQLSFATLRDILLQLLAPLLAGQLLRRWIGDWVTQHKTVLGFADRGSILVIIYVAFSKGMTAHVWGQIGPRDLVVLIGILVGLLTLVLFVTGAFARRVLGLSVEDDIVVQFCGSKKSLASGLPIASVLFAGSQLSLIVLPLMLFHQLQLIVCAVLARCYAERPEVTDSAMVAVQA